MTMWIQIWDGMKSMVKKYTNMQECAEYET